MYKIAVKIAYIFFVNLLKILPRSLAVRFGEALSFIYYLFARKSTAIMRDNLKAIMGDNYKESALINVFKNFSFYLVDFIKIKPNNKKFFSSYVTVENKHIIEEAFRVSGGGAIGLSMHLGNWEFAGGHFAYMGYPISAVALDHSIKYVDNLFKRQRRNLGIEELPFKDSFRICSRKLQEKRVLALLADRDFTGNFMKAELFGKDYYFPKAPFLLSLKCRVPLFFGVTVRDGFGYKTIIEGPFVYKSFTISEMHSIIGEVHRIMEKYLKLYPEQWFFFQRFWEKPQDVVIL